MHLDISKKLKEKLVQEIASFIGETESKMVIEIFSFI